MSTQTHERLFIPPADPHSFFEKDASIARMPDDEKKWPAHLLSELHKQLPFVSDYDVDLTLDRQDPEAGYGLGYAMLQNKRASAVPMENVGDASNRIRIPLIIEDRMLQPFHTFELGGGTYPLTSERVKSAMVDPALFDSAVSKVPRPRSLVDQISPPYQQRQGFGRIAEPDSSGLAGIGKSASAPEAEFLNKLSEAGRFRVTREGSLLKTGAAEDAPSYRKGGETSCAGCKFFKGDGASSAQCAKYDFQAMPDYTCDSWVTKDASKEASHTKEARLNGGYGHAVPSGSFGDSWLKRFEHTPFLDEAYAMKEAETVREAQRAEVRAAHAQARADDAQFDIKVASLEGDYARWRMSQLGSSMVETLGKLASCRHDHERTWSEEFRGSPFHKQAMQLSIEDAHREVARAKRETEDDAYYSNSGNNREKRAELELKLENWRFQAAYGDKMASVKQAMSMLRFVQGSGAPGSMVFSKMTNPPRFRSPVPPQNFWFYPLQGTNFLMGVQRDMQKKLEKEQDQQKLRSMLAGPMRDEMMAARGNMPALGRFILVVKKGDKYQYVKPEFTPALANAGGGNVGVQQALSKKANTLAARCSESEKVAKKKYPGATKYQSGPLKGKAKLTQSRTGATLAGGLLSPAFAGLGAAPGRVKSTTIGAMAGEAVGFGVGVGAATAMAGPGTASAVLAAPSLAALGTTIGPAAIPVGIGMMAGSAAGAYLGHGPKKWEKGLPAQVGRGARAVGRGAKAVALYEPKHQPGFLKRRSLVKEHKDDSKHKKASLSDFLEATETGPFVSREKAASTVGEIANRGVPSPEEEGMSPGLQDAISQGQQEADMAAQQEQAAQEEAAMQDQAAQEQMAAEEQAAAQEAAPPKKKAKKKEDKKDSPGHVTVNVHTGGGKSEKKAEVEYHGKTFPGYNQPIASDRPEKKKMVLAKKGDEVRLIHFGQKGYKHNYSESAKKNYLSRSAGIRGKGGKLTKDDKFSANYWARRELWPQGEPADGTAKDREKKASLFDKLAEDGEDKPRQAPRELSRRWAYTDAGHKMEAARSKAKSTYLQSVNKARDEYSKERPISHALQLGGVSRARDKYRARGAEFDERKHESGSNPWNPLGGMLTPHSGEKKKKSEKKASIFDKLYGVHVVPGRSTDVSL